MPKNVDCLFPMRVITIFSDYASFKISSLHLFIYRWHSHCSSIKPHLRSLDIVSPWFNGFLTIHFPTTGLAQYNSEELFLTSIDKGILHKIFLDFWNASLAWAIQVTSLIRNVLTSNVLNIPSAAVILPKYILNTYDLNRSNLLWFHVAFWNIVSL